MSGSHDKLPLIFWIQIALVVIVGVLYLFMPSPPKHSEHGSAEESMVSDSTKAALKPIGEVAVGSAAGESGGGGRSADEIVKKTCMSCHAVGIANAPKMDASGKDAWTPRLAGGLDALVASAKKGKGAMPPSGADPSLSDDELKAAIVYMLEKAGIEIKETPDEANQGDGNHAVSAGESEKVTEEAPKAAAVMEVPITPSEPSVPEMPIKPTTPSIPTTPGAPAIDANATSDSVLPPQEPREASAATNPAMVATEVKEPEAHAPSLAVAPIAATAVAATEAAAEISAPPAPSAPAEVSNEAPKAPEVVAPTAPEGGSADLVVGEKIYKSLCFSCHDTGVANAPKPGNKEAWAARIAKGMDALNNTAVKGDSSMPAMPAKGGNPTLSDDDVRDAVAYMVELSK